MRTQPIALIPTSALFALLTACGSAPKPKASPRSYSGDRTVLPVVA